MKKLRKPLSDHLLKEFICMEIELHLAETAKLVSSRTAKKIINIVGMDLSMSITKRIFPVIKTHLKARWNNENI